jgi:undecaprenyl-diphosphatase
MNLLIFRYLNSLAGHSAFEDKFIVFLATTFGILLIVAALLFLYGHHESNKKRIKEVMLVFVTALVAWFAASILKNLIHAPRPYVMMQNVKALFMPDDNLSMPSGHATFFMALATAIYFYHKKIGYVFALGALLIGLARVIAGIHFPADILAGFIIGVAIAFGVAYFRKKV